MRRENVIEWKMQKDMKRRLNGIAMSFENLSKSIENFAQEPSDLTRDTLGTMFDDISEKVCCGCTDCKRCWIEEEMTSCAELADWLDRLEQAGTMPEEAEKEFFRNCIRRERLLQEWEHHLAEYRNGLVWKNRVKESREAVAGQLNEMARIVGEFAGNRGREGDKIYWLPKSIYWKMMAHQIHVKNLLAIVRKDGLLEVHMTARCLRGHCVTSKEAAMILGCYLGERLVPSIDSKNVIGKEEAEYTFLEDANFQVITGIARTPRADSRISGDNFSFLYPETGEVIMLLADGMGSGKEASAESECVIELLEQFLEAGFREESAMRLVNSALSIRCDTTMFSTVDICVIHKTTGMCDFLKAGASATYIVHQDWLEQLSSTTLPAGMISGISYDTAQKKLYDGDYVILLSDGVVGESGDAEFLREVLESNTNRNPQEIANQILDAAMKRENYEPKDDMTVLVAGVFGK